MSGIARSGVARSGVAKSGVARSGVAKSGVARSAGVAKSAAFGTGGPTGMPGMQSFERLGLQMRIFCRLLSLGISEQALIKRAKPPSKFIMFLFMVNSFLLLMFLEAQKDF
jgi:hypothetical protein